MPRFRIVPALAIAFLALGVACGGKKPPVAAPAPAAQPAAPPVSAPAPARQQPPPAPTPIVEPPVVPMEPLAVDDLNTKDLDTINRAQPLKPAFFAFDSDELDAAAQAALNDDAQTLKKYGTWAITIEGHCDERGTAEYNLALAERRALAAKNYLVSLGVAAARLKTVSYGKEFPFDPGHTEAAWAKNRRAHFVVTGK
jgi:peptidoglycan-associated lipoprotein